MQSKGLEIKNYKILIISEKTAKLEEIFSAEDKLVIR